MRMRKILLATVAAVPLLAVGMMSASSQDLKQKGKENITQSQGQGKAEPTQGKTESSSNKINQASEKAQDKAQPKTEGRANSQEQTQGRANSEIDKQADQAKPAGKQGQAENERIGQSAKDKAQQGAKGSKNELSQGQSKAKQSTVKQPNGADNEPARTSGQATRPNQESGRQPGSGEPSQRTPQNNAQQNGTQQDNAQQNAKGESRAGTAEGRVTLNEEQRTKIQKTVLSGRDVPRVDSVNFRIDVGVDVPREVRVVEVPETLIEIHPEWRGHEYFVVSDEIVIVDTNRHIVAVVPVGSSSASTETRSSTTTVSTSFESPEQIRRVQEVLIEKGFYHGQPDGRMGPETRDGLIKFQEREGIEARGRLDERTFTALGISVGRTEGQGTQGQAEPKAGQASTSGQAGSPNSTEPRNREDNASNPQNNNPGNKAEESKRPSTSGQAGKTQGQSEPQSTSGQAGKQPSANPDERKPDNKAGQQGGTEGRSMNRQNQPAATGKSQEDQRKRD